MSNSDNTKIAEETKAELIQRSRILDGFLLRDFGRVEHKRVNPVAIANDANVNLYLKNPFKQSLESRDLFYESKESYETARSLAEEGCESWANSFKLDAGAQFDGITGAFSLSGARAKAIQLDQARATAQKESIYEWYQVYNTVSRKKDVEIPKEDLILTKDAVSALQDINKLIGQDDLLRAALDKFFDKFGSHVLSYATLGGTYKFIGHVEADAKAGAHLIHVAVSTRLQKEAHAAFKMSFLGFSIGVGEEESSFKQETKAWQDQAEFTNIVSSTTVTKEVVGGVAGNGDEWLNSLNHDNWVIVDRDMNYAIPIWEIVERSQNELPNTNLSTLMSIMRNHWVIYYLKSLKVQNYQQLEVLLKEDAENREVITRAKFIFQKEITDNHWIPSDVDDALKRLQESLNSKKEAEGSISEIINQKNKGLRILGATYSDANVIKHVRGKIDVKNNAVDIGASPDEFGFDPHPSDIKFVYIVYQYGANIPRTLILYSGTSQVISEQFSNPERWNQQFKAGELIILGAAYGRQNKTDHVQVLVKDNALDFQPNQAFPEDLPNIGKFAVVVYRYWPDEPQVIAVREGDRIIVRRK